MNRPAPRSGPTRRRRRLRVALGVLILAGLIAADVWASLGAELRNYRVEHNPEVAVAPPGRATSYAGATWRLRSLRKMPTRAWLPPETTALAVRVSVTPHDWSAAERIKTCDLTLHGGEGRSWDSGTLDDLEVRAPGPVTCLGQGPHDRVRPGSTRTLRLAFVVPREVAGEVELWVKVSDASPRYLRFAREGG